MSLAVVAGQDDRPPVADLIERAARIAEIARERAPETEQARRVSPELVAEMRDADLFKLLQPKRFGGYEYGFDVFALTRRVASLRQLFLDSVEGFGNLGYRYFVRASFQA